MLAGGFRPGAFGLVWIIMHLDRFADIAFIAAAAPRLLGKRELLVLHSVSDYKIMGGGGAALHMFHAANFPLSRAGTRVRLQSPENFRKEYGHRKYHPSGKNDYSRITTMRSIHILHTVHMRSFPLRNTVPSPKVYHKIKTNTSRARFFGKQERMKRMNRLVSDGHPARVMV